MEAAKEGNLYRVEVIAQLFGVTVRRVQQLTQEGIIKTVPDGHGARRYDLAPTVQAYIKYLSDRAYGRNKTEKEVELKELKMRAEIALKESQGELHRLKTAIASGKYIHVDEVALDYSRFFVAFKNFAVALPARLTDMISGYIDPVEARSIEKSLQAETRKLLRNFVAAGVTPGDLTKRGRKRKEEPEANEASETIPDP